MLTDQPEAGELERHQSIGVRLSNFISQWIDRLQPSSELVLMVTALIVGIGAGLGAVVFRYLINGVGWIGYTWFPQISHNWGKAYVIIVPAIGGLLVGPLVYFFAREAKGHGVPEVMEAVALKGGRIRPRVAIVKSLASALSIGSGGSVGREGPIVQIGSALGSSLGQLLRLSEDRVRNLVACGAAGGIAATFNAPIAGVIFALEIILGEFTIQGFSTVVISSVAASVIGRVVFGDIPGFIIPTEYGITSLWEFLFFPVLGGIVALFGVLYTRSIYWTEDLFDNWKKVPEWVKPAVGGILLGLLAFAYPALTGVTWDKIPHVYNVGYNIIESALASKLVLGTAITLMFAKLVATSLTIGSGGSGGVFAPSLFIGAMVGAAFELVIKSIFPDIIAPEGAYALLGMAAMFASSAHAPITAVLILFELTGDYRLILPLMLTVVVATVIAQRLMRGESIYTLKLSRRGVRLKRGRDVDLMESVLVRDVMSTQHTTVNFNVAVSSLAELFLQTNQHAFVVLDDDGRLFGIVSLTDYRRVSQNNASMENLVVKDIATRALVTAFPDETLRIVLQRMAPRDLSRIPVISREDQKQLLGVVRRNDIIRAYRTGTARRGSSIGRLAGHPPGTRIVQLAVPKGTPLANKCLAELVFPEDFLVIHVLHKGETILPHGDTSLQPDDIVTFLVKESDIDRLEAFWKDLQKQES
ncbi:MAG: chloride channel protein [Anaerolineales bacterium]|nr:chloride channel protein [Anaerolineales bacterium]